MRYFHLDEFRCPCCGTAPMDDDFLFKLDFARHRAGIPFNIRSGYRCALHNEEVGGAKDSSHLKGSAADIYVNGDDDRYKIFCGGYEAGFNRIGVYPLHIHVDSDVTKNENRIWVRS